MDTGWLPTRRRLHGDNLLIWWIIVSCSNEPLCQQRRSQHHKIFYAAMLLRPSSRHPCRLAVRQVWDALLTRATILDVSKWYFWHILILLIWSSVVWFISILCLIEKVYGTTLTANTSRKTISSARMILLFTRKNHYYIINNNCWKLAKKGEGRMYIL